MKDRKKSEQNLQWYLEQPMEVQLEMFKHYVEIAKILSNQLFEDEIRSKAGEKYQREPSEERRYSRWGSNPGSIRIGEEKVKVQAPRLFDHQNENTTGLESYQKLRETELPSEELLKKIILGLSEHDYEKVVKMGAENFGLSQSSVSKAFIEESKKVLENFEKRDLGLYDFIALVIDGKYLSRENVVIAMGITITGEKMPLGFIQTTTENSKAIKGLLRNLIGRNFRFTDGILTIIDGSKGLRKAVGEVFGEYALVQRCQWHKRENVVSYLKEEDKEKYRGKLQRAYSEPIYEIAKSRLFEIRDDLKKINRTAANSMEEGLEETLTMHRLGLVEELGRSFTTTNVIESLNSMLAKYLRRVKKWNTRDMRARWVATALVEIETRMRRVNNYHKLHLLRTAIKSELKINQNMVA